jgi:hypothetical protein
MATETMCPRCGHRASSHPHDGRSHVCSVALNELPSCVECAAPLASLAIRQPDEPPTDPIGPECSVV